ncbi:restriction endonuclease subunit S [Empedobacter falsenii]
MKQQHTLQPKLRFPEFSYDILSKNAGDLFINHSNKKHNGNLEILAITQDKGAIPRSLINYEVQVSDESVSNYKVVEKGDFIISLRSFQGGIEYSNYDGICSPAYIILKSQTTIVDDYYKFYLKTYNYIIQLRRTLEGIRDGKMIPFKYFSDTILINPELPEQQKIADYLSTIDEKLTLLEEKKTELSHYKKAMMQKLFSQEIRFKDENGNDFSDWEEKRLGDFLVKYDEKTTEHDQYPVLTSSRKGIFFQKDYYNGQDVASSNTTGYNIVPKGYFTYRHMSDDLIFKFNINTICGKGIVSTLYPVFTTKNINDEFLRIKLNEGNEFSKYAILQKQGGSRTYMYFKKLTELRLELPSFEEQKKIADFLSTIDESIAKVSEQINETQNFKKAMLQQMFV